MIKMKRPSFMPLWVWGCLPLLSKFVYLLSSIITESDKLHQIDMVHLWQKLNLHIKSLWALHLAMVGSLDGHLASILEPALVHVIIAHKLQLIKCRIHPLIHLKRRS